MTIGILEPGTRFSCVTNPRGERKIVGSNAHRLRHVLNKRSAKTNARSWAELLKKGIVEKVSEQVFWTREVVNESEEVVKKEDKMIMTQQEGEEACNADQVPQKTDD